MLDTTSSRLERMLRPRSIAIVGASADGKRIGGRPLRYLVDYGYGGRLYAVNPKYEDIRGIPCFPDIASLPEAVDLAMLMVSGEQVIVAAEACAERGVGGIVVSAAGFAEEGAAGRARQDRLAEIGRASGMRILGPNTIGFRDQRKGVFATFATDLDSGRRPGNIAVIVQSGGLGGYFGGAQLRELGIGTGYLIDTGNEVDVDAAECLEFVATDPDVNVIGLILESARDGRRLLDAALAAREQGVPVILLKTGVSAAGVQAVALHTGSIAGEADVWEAALRAAGVLYARDEAHFLDMLHLLDAGKVPRGRGIGVLSLSGGVATVLIDAAERFGMTLPAYSPPPPELQQEFPFVHFSNPLDASGQMANTPGGLEPLLKYMLGHEEIDVAVVWLAYALLSPIVGPPMMQAVAAAAQSFDKPIVVCGMATPEMRDELNAAGVRVLAYPTRLVEALATCAGFADQPTLVRPVASVRQTPITATDIITGPRAQARLKGIVFGATDRVDSAVEARASAGRLGYPVVLKVEADGLAHKSELGLVKVGLGDPGAVEQAFRALRERMREHSIDGAVYCQAQEGGVEVFAGLKHDPVFGPVIVVGLGGIFVEVLQDAVTLLAPVRPEDVLAALPRLRGYSLLTGARGRPPADISALADTVSRLSQLALQDDGLVEVDLNPIIVKPGTGGAVAVDAVLRVKS